MVIVAEGSWLFSRHERSAHIWIDTDRASKAEKQPTGRSPQETSRRFGGSALANRHQLRRGLCPCSRVAKQSTCPDADMPTQTPPKRFPSRAAEFERHDNHDSIETAHQPERARFAAP
jgi:hypothetical protein